MTKPNTSVVVRFYIKDPDQWGELIDGLGLSESQIEKYFEWHEYATVELKFDKSLKVISGRVLPK